MEKGTNFLYSVKYQQNTQKRASHMSNLNTELMTALLKNESIDEVFRSHLEAAMNDLLKIELTQFLGYEKSSILGYNTGNSRNGFYERDLDTSYGRLQDRKSTRLNSSHRT